MRHKIKIIHALCLIWLSLYPHALASGGDSSKRQFEYLWYEAENMRGVATDERHEPYLNPSWMNRPRVEAPGWGMNGPGVSAEWSQGGESEWNSLAASHDEIRATVTQEIEVPRAGSYRLWVRYADWARRGENFAIRITQQGREISRHEFGVRDRIDSHDEVGMYWGWAFMWDAAPAVNLSTGAARVSIEIERAADARRHVDCFLLTNDPGYQPEGRRKPPFAATRVLREWNEQRPSLAPLIEFDEHGVVPPAWRRPLVANRDFQMPWNISEKFWELSELSPDATATAARPLYPFNAEPIEAFVEKYKGAREVPLFDSKLVVPVIYINELGKHLKEGSAFVRYLRETRAPFAILINYGTLTLTEAEGQEAWKLLTGELSGQFLGWISGESIGYVWPDVKASLKLSPDMSRRELLEANRIAYTRALEKKWSGLFHVTADAMWPKLIPALSTASTTYAHALGRWGVKLIGMETAAVMPNTAMRIAFTRGGARQSGSAFLYYHAPNFGDTATTFTEAQNFAGPRHFFHTRYGATMGPSLAWYRKNYYLYYMAGASAIYLEQGFDQFFQPGPGTHSLQLNPLGRITDEFMRFAEKHPERGTPYTPVAFLLDPAHGWEMTDYPHYPFGVSPINRSDRALRELFGAAYYPTNVVEGEPATADRQAFVNSIFGDVCDVLVASAETRPETFGAYRALIAGGHIEWQPGWAERLDKYVRGGGTLVLNAAQARGLPSELLGVRVLNQMAEADDAACLAANEAGTNLSGQMFRYARVEPRGGVEVLMRAPSSGDPLVTVHRVGRGRVVFCAIPDLLGLDERITPIAAHLLTHLLADVTPLQIRGEIQHLVNRTPTGWVVTLINNRGVYKPQQGLARVERDEAADVSIALRGNHKIERANEWTTETEVEVKRNSGGPDQLAVRVPPGGVRIVELTTRH
ncbi:MAG: hypothetical protein H0T45_16610 [Pyrinomonadaceae bacterium]|nr:hypothetical protein [Pyrinomonadaceae bacterium]